MKLLDFSRLCQALGGRSRSSVYRDVAAGRLPAPVKLGGRLYWREADIEARIEELADAE
jgi:prophage regulatory protein